MKSRIRLSGYIFFVMLHVLSFLLFTPSNSFSEKKKQITMMFPLHIDVGVRSPFNSTNPTSQSTSVMKITNMLEKYNVKGFYQFCGNVLQQLQEDYPETVDQIKRLKMPIGYHGGVGHNEPNQFGKQRILNRDGMSREEAQRAEIIATWDFETHALISNWSFDEESRVIMKNPRQGERMTLEDLSQYNIRKSERRLYGGKLAIQEIYNIRIIESGNRGIEFGRIHLSLGEDVDNAIVLPDMHEPYLFPDNHNLPYKYYGKDFGEDVPRVPDSVEWLRALSTVLPDGYTYYIQTMMHGVNLDIVGEDLEKLLSFFASHPEDFRIAWPDPDETQWKPENNALDFYKKTYNVSSLKEIRDMACPVEKILELQQETERSVSFAPRSSSEQKLKTKKQTQSRTITQSQMLAATENLLTQWPQDSHDADYGGPPEYISFNGNYLSLSETYQALSFFLADYARNQNLPEETVIEPVGGPVDYPMIFLQEEPVIDPVKRSGGYMARELPKKFFPDAELIWKQGLPMQEENHLWMPIHAIAEGDMILHAAWEAEQFIKEKGHIPGISNVSFVAYNTKNYPLRRNLYKELKVNAGEFLYAMAQEYRYIFETKRPGEVAMISMKICSDQNAGLIVPYTPYQGNGPNTIAPLKFQAFVYREPLTEKEIDIIWNYKP